IAHSHSTYSVFQQSYFLDTCLLFFFNDPPTTEIYTLSLHDALPIFAPDTYRPHTTPGVYVPTLLPAVPHWGKRKPWVMTSGDQRSEEHTSELQSRENLVCRLLLEKKK